eukprot:6014446-Alexandrium_andersonii.AAC.1
MIADNLLDELVPFDVGLPADTVAKAWADFFVALGDKVSSKDAVKKMESYSAGCVACAKVTSAPVHTAVAATAVPTSELLPVMPDLIAFKDLYDVRDD